MDGAFVHKRMGYTVYILQSDRDGSYYVGQTSNLEERVRRHNQGRSLYTKSKTPWTLVYSEAFHSCGEAMRREREIKGKKYREYVEHLVRAYPGSPGEGCPDLRSGSLPPLIKKWG